MAAALAACVVNCAASPSRTVGSSPEPGRITANASSPTTVATMVDTSAKPSVRAPTLPTCRASPSDAVPTRRLLTTSGSTIIVMSRMNAVPSGSMARMTVWSQTMSFALAMTPIVAPNASAMRIFV